MDFIDHRSTAQFTFLTSATDEKMRINADGDLLVGISTPFDTSGITLDATGALGVDGHITVATGATYDIGTATNKFRDLYLSGDINVAGVSTSGDLTVGGSLSVTTDATVTGSLTVSTDATITNDLTVSNDATVSGDLTVSTNAVIAGDLTVNGTTTTINTETLDVKDKNITLNYGGDTTSADGAGITIEDAVSAGTDATILWDGSSDTFDFSHAIDVTGTITADNNLTIQNSAAYGSIELGGVSGGFIDIKRPFSDDYDLRLIAEGDGGVINVASGELTIQRAGSAKLATTSTGIAITGNATFADNGKAIFGAGSDLQIYHDGSNSYIWDNGTGLLQLRTNGSEISLVGQNGTEFMGRFQQDGAVKLYYDNAQKFATTSTGIDVTGSVVSDGLDLGATTDAATVSTTASDYQLQLGAAQSTTGDIGRNISFGISGVTTAAINSIDAGSSNAQTLAFFTGNASALTKRLSIDSIGDISFYEDTGTTAKLTWDASAESLNFADNGKAIFGAGSDLQIYHDGSNSYIAEGGTGNLQIQGQNLSLEDSTGTRFFLGIQGGETRLYNQGNEKVAVTATGIDVTGSISADGLIVDTAIATSTASFRATTNSTTIGQKIGSLDFFNGTTNAAGTLEVRRASGGNAYSDMALMASANGNRSNQLLLSTNGDISFYNTAGTSQSLFWDASAESLGIGTTTPGATIDVSDAFAAINLESATGTNQVQVKVSNTGGGAFFGRENSAGSWFGTGEAYATTLRSDGAYPMIFRVNGGNRLVLDDGGNVGIGTDSPSAILNLSSSSNTVLRLDDTNGTDSYHHIETSGTNGQNLIISADQGGTGGGALVIRNNGGSEAMRIDSSGNLLVGRTSTTTSNIGVTIPGSGAIQATANFNALGLNRLSGDGDIAVFQKSGTTVGSIGSRAGTVLYITSEGTNETGLDFGGTSINPMLSGALSNGTTDLGNAGNRFSDLYLSGGLRGDTLTFKNLAGSERTRIDSSGNQLWGKTSADNTTQGIRFLGSSGFMSVVRSNDTLAVWNRIGGDGTLLEFRTSGTTRGSISISGSTTSYNTTSDERLKQNIEDADDAGAIVDSIQVRKFDWIDGGEHQRYGMVAQELSTVAPEAVSVPDDAEEMQSVDYSKLVPMLIKEIQSLRARVAQLEGEN